MAGVTSMWAIAAAATAVLAPTVVQTHQANMAARDARNENSRREGKQRELEQDFQKKQGEEAALDKSTMENQAARQRQKALAANFSGRAGTILTSPLGASGGGNPASPTPGGKTLLGA